MADLGTAPAKPSAAEAPNGAAAFAAEPIQEEPAAVAEHSAGPATPAALQEVQSGPTPPEPPTAGKRLGDIPPDSADGVAQAAIVAARLPADMLLEKQGANSGLPAGEGGAGGQPGGQSIESLAAGADEADAKLHTLAHTAEDELHAAPAAGGGQGSVGAGAAVGAAALAADLAASAMAAGMRPRQRFFRDTFVLCDRCI